MRILVCGGRNYDDRDAVWGELDAMRAKYGCLTVIQGGATGADMLAREWAYKQNSVRLINEPAQWDDLSHKDALIRYHASGKPYDAKAGTRRNAKMLREYKPDLVVAFPGGNGTKDCVNKAKRLGIKVLEVGSERRREVEMRVQEHSASAATSVASGKSRKGGSAAGQGQS